MIPGYTKEKLMSMERCRPMKREYPPRVDASAENIVQAMFDHKWEYEESGLV